METSTIEKRYILNRETSKIELHFSKEEYQALSNDQKTELKRAYIFSGQRKAWVSRSTKDHYSAIRVAEKLGFVDGGKVGERLSYAEELERKAEKAEARAERYEEYADNAECRAENLQSEFNELRKDWSWLTQPNINSSRGRSFTNQRNRVLDRYNKGFNEYRKSEYFKERAETAQMTASNIQLKDKVYLYNRIEETNKRIREIERAIVTAEEKQNEKWLESLLEKMEYEIDKLAFFENCMDELGGVKYSKDNIKVGYHIKIRGHWDEVLKANPKTVLSKVIEGGAKGFVLDHPYAEIQDMRIPEGWKEVKNEMENPFVVGDIVAQIFHRGSSHENLYRAFQIVKTTSKSVNIQQINIDNGQPVKDSFKSDEQLLRRVGKDRNGEYVVNYDNYFLFKYETE